MAKIVKEIPKEKLELYSKLVKTIPEVALKGASLPYTSLNGNMFSYLGESGLALRLPAEARELFLIKYKTTLYHSYGIIQKEYVTVPDDLLKKTKKLKKYFGLSYEYVSSLKPKPTKRK